MKCNRHYDVRYQGTFCTMKSQFCSNSGNSDINFVNTYSNNGACGVRIFVVCWSSRKRICRRSKMADSHSEGVRRWHIRTEHYNKLGARGGESIQRSSNKMPLSFRTTKLDSKIGSHRIDPGGEEAEGGLAGTSGSVTARYINRKPYTGIVLPGWSQLTVALQSPVSSYNAPITNFAFVFCTRRYNFATGEYED